MPEIKLKNCPFCGREVTTKVSVIYGTTTMADRIRFAACCPACRIQQAIDIESPDTFEEAEKAMQKAVEAWNRRTENEM